MRRPITPDHFGKILCLCVLGLAISAKTPAHSQTIEDAALPVEAKQFTPAFSGNDAITFATAYGDRNKHEHGTFGRFPANFETPSHTHSHDYRAVVISGEMTNPFEGQKNPPILRPGSFWSVSAGSVHTTACVSSTPCEFFMYSAKPFDFKPSN